MKKNCIIRLNEDKFEITTPQEPLVEKGTIKDLENELVRLQSEKDDIEQKSITFTLLKETETKIKELKDKIAEIKKEKIQ